MNKSDELARHLIRDLGLENKRVSGLTIKLRHGEPAIVEVEMTLPKELDGFLSAIATYELNPERRA